MEILRFPGLGWELPISRVALSIGNLDIYWYGVIIAVGFGLGLMFNMESTSLPTGDPE